MIIISQTLRTFPLPWCTLDRLKVIGHRCGSMFVLNQIENCQFNSSIILKCGNVPYRSCSKTNVNECGGSISSRINDVHRYTSDVKWEPDSKQNSFWYIIMNICLYSMCDISDNRNFPMLMIWLSVFVFSVPDKTR